MIDRHTIALILLLVGCPIGIVLASLSHRVRDACFVLLIVLAPFSEYMAVNFFSRDWYRGTSRGVEFCGLDVLVVSILFASILHPRGGRKRAFWPGSLVFMFLFLVFSTACVVLTEPRLYGVFALAKLARGILVFVAAAWYVRSAHELRLLVFALGGTVCYLCLFALFQRYHQGIDRVYATLDDSNSLSMYLCATTPLFVAAINSHFPRHLKILSGVAIALACVGVILTISRAGVVAMGTILIGCALITMSYRITLRRLVVAPLIVLLAGGVLAKSWHTLKERFDESTLKQEYADKDSQGRGFYIRMALAILHDHWLGVGPNNWSYWVTNVYGPRYGWTYVPYYGTDIVPTDKVPSGGNVDEAQAAPAHSLAALVAGETGILGLFLFSLIWLRWFQMGFVFLWQRAPDPMRRIGVGLFFCTLGIFMQSFTEWVFFQTQIFFTFHVLAGALAGIYYERKQELCEQATEAASIDPQFCFDPNPA